MVLKQASMELLILMGEMMIYLRNFKNKLLPPLAIILFLYY